MGSDPTVYRSGLGDLQVQGTITGGIRGGSAVLITVPSPLSAGSPLATPRSGGASA